VRLWFDRQTEAKAMKHYKHLTREQRYTIECMNRQQCPQQSIAEAIGVDPSTISRELQRAGMNSDSYSHLPAQKHADAREWKGRRISPELLIQVESKLRLEQWSPEQISGHFRKENLGQISHETIYQHIYRDQKSGGNLHLQLRHHCKTYRKRGLGRERRGRIKNQVMIDQRPAIVAERSRLGDWEVDTVIGGPGGKVLVTIVERKSRYTLIALVPNKKSAPVTEGMLLELEPHKAKVLTLTYDNGKEFSEHEKIAEQLEAKGYFAHPYHAWERGLNENTNGLIRQYFPKGSDFSKLTQQEVKRVELLLNTRPRKCLAYQTPHDIFHPPPPLALAT
jgi:IS30 family transposase